MAAGVPRNLFTKGGHSLKYRETVLMLKSIGFLSFSSPNPHFFIYFIFFRINSKIIKRIYGDYIPLYQEIITPIILNVKGEFIMIKFDRLWETMKKKNITTYYLREKSGIDSKTVRRLKSNDNIETKTLDKLCRVLNCRLEDIAEYIPEDD